MTKIESITPRRRMGVTIASNLQFIDVCHHYGDHETLRNLSLEIESGQVVSLLGPSGSGKTTLLRLAAGLVQPTSGEIRINNQIVASDRGMVPPEKRNIGLVFQDFALFPHLNVINNVEFGLTQMVGEERRDYAHHMLRTVGLEHKAKHYPHQLSGGEQQRAALARALAPKPGILLMDEPFSGLDGRLRERVRDETLAILREARATVIVVTHDPEEALRISDRIALMKNGEIVQYGTCQSLYYHPVSLFAARFFSEVNQFQGKFSDGVVETAIGSFRYRGSQALGEGAVVVCLRPSDIELVPAGALEQRREGDKERALKTAFVQSKRFIGEHQLVDLYIPEGEICLQAKLSADAKADKGQAVYVSLAAEKAQVFKAE